jgi:hypothetical protein
MTIETEARPERPKRRPRPGNGKASTSVEAVLQTAAPPPIPGRRNPKWIALGVVALCLGALLSYVIYSRVADQTSVVAVVTTVHRGQTVTAADLTSVRLSGGVEVGVVPASQLHDLVGRRAVYDLVGGSLLPVGAVADVVVPRTGHAVVGVRLVSGRAPSGEIPPGSPLRLVALPPAGAEVGFTDEYSGRTILAREISQVSGADGTSIVVNVDVGAAQAPVVALLASQERLAIVRDADR